MNQPKFYKFFKSNIATFTDSDMFDFRVIDKWSAGQIDTICDH